MFFVIRKNQIFLVLLLIATLISAFMLYLKTSDKEATLCRSYLKELGYNSEKMPYEKADVKIPEGFGKVYEDYNLIQKEAGFDLTPLRGTMLTRYSFHLVGESFPIANIFVSKGRICGGDLLDPSLSGKIAPLIPKEKE